MLLANASPYGPTGLDFLIAAGVLAVALFLAWRFYGRLQSRFKARSWLDERLSRLEQSLRDKNSR